MLVVRETQDGARSLLNPGSQVILPIHNRFALVYSWETPKNLIQPGGPLDRNQIYSLSRDYFYESNSRYIFGRSRESLERAQMSLLQWNSKEHSTHVSNGWMEMQRELQRTSEQRKERDETHELELDAVAQKLVYRAKHDLESS